MPPADDVELEEELDVDVPASLSSDEHASNVATRAK